MSAELDMARAGGDYLIRHQGPSGAFRYVLDPYRPEPQDHGYNLLRHAGTAWALFGLGRAANDRRYVEAGARAVGLLLRHCRIEGQRAYVLDPGTEKAKLGALGLTLLALAEQEAVDGGDDGRRAVMGFLADQILDLQRPDGRFESYVRQDGKPSSDWRSLYYPGEAMLGLVRYAALIDPLEAARYLAAVHDGIAYLLRAQTEALETGQAATLPPDAWLVQAIEAVLLLDAGPGVRADWVARYVEHALRLGEAILVGQVDADGPTALVGGFAPFPAPSCRSAARAEGLLAALRIGRRHGPPDGRLDAIGAGLWHAERHVELHRYRSTGAPLADAHGGIAMSARDPGIRIDTVQHAISMWLGIAALGATGGAS